MCGLRGFAFSLPAKCDDANRNLLKTSMVREA